MKYILKTILKLSLLMSITTSHAQAELSRLGGFSIGDVCHGSEFKIIDVKVSNPTSSEDKISTKRNSMKKSLEGGYELSVNCDIVNQKVYYIALTSNDLSKIIELEEMLMEKMGRLPDDNSSIYRKPSRLMGMNFDGHRMESDYWFLSANIKATGYSYGRTPYGSNSLNDIIWKGGIELLDTSIAQLEWNYLIEKGIRSSSEIEAEKEAERKNKLDSLLE